MKGSYFENFSNPHQQKYLRNRVASVAYFEADCLNDSEFENWVLSGIFENTCHNSAIHYSYDIHGNVNLLVYDVPYLERHDRQYVTVDYEYDLISGNVNKVIFQKDKHDRFFHRYEYDGNNRLANTFTSRNGLIWDEDAFYAYYPHGPLLRTELGENKVQGIDYAYTLQGWLKGVNSATMNSADDMGKDGQLVQGNPNALIGRDVFGFTLDYYHDTLNHKYDFLAIGRNDQGFVDFEPNRLQSDLYQPGVSLFNGNISYMTTAIASPSGLDAYPVQISSAPMVRKFRYDKLNRIAEQEVAFVGSNKSWNNATTAFATNYSYDANGNLLTLNRNQQTGVLMDELEYSYFTSNDDYYSGQKINRLQSVEDLSLYDQYELDFKGISNYTYDEIGNLITDSGEEIEEIVWNTYGKVTHVIREDGSLKSDLEFWYDPMGNRLCKIVKPRDEYGSPTNQSQWVFTWYMRDAQGNVMAVYNETHATDTARLYVGEYSIYGSSRLGVHNSNELISEIEYDTWQFADGFFKSDWTEIAYAELNDTLLSVCLYDVQYELSNHLGNVLTTITAKPIFIYDINDVFKYKSAEVLSVNDYFPGGFPMPNRGYNSGLYRYGHNQQESDAEITGNWGTHYTAEYWMYDSRTMRRWNIDPVVKPWESPYACFSNNPILIADIKGDDGEKPKKKKTTTDAGHGIKGTNNPKVDPGTVDGTHYEKDYALIIEKQVDKWLTVWGVENQRTREDDLTINEHSINYRWKLANDNESDVYVSIHLNSGDDPGLFILYNNALNKQSGNPKELAQSIINNTHTLPIRKSNPIYEDKTKYLQFFSGDAAVLIELGGIGNGTTRNLIINKSSDIGREIATGIFYYLYGNLPPEIEPPQKPTSDFTKSLDYLRNKTKK